MDYRDLAYLGLNEKEAKVYLAALELGKSPVQKISEKAGVNRATTYVIIETLSKRGLMSSSNENKKQFFHAEAPEKLSLLFREEAMAIQRKQEYLDKILPDLKSLNVAIKEKPVVRYYEGKSGIRAISEEFYLAKHKEPARLIYSYDLLKEYFTEEELLQMRTKRQKLDVKAVILVNDKNNQLKTDAKKYIVDAKEFPISNDIAIFDNKVRIVIQKGDLAGFVIENEEIYKTFKTLFDLAIEGIKRKKGSK